MELKRNVSRLKWGNWGSGRRALSPASHTRGKLQSGFTLEQVGSSADCTECPGELSQGSSSLTVLSTCVPWKTSHNKALFKYISYSVFCVFVLPAQSCPALCYPMDCSLPDYSVHRILKRRILEWVAMSSSGDFPDPGVEPRSFHCWRILRYYIWSLIFFFFRLIKNQGFQGL